MAMSLVPKLYFTTLNIKTSPFKFLCKISLEIRPYIWLSNMDFCQLSNYCWNMELPLLSRITMERNLLIWLSTLISKICSNNKLHCKIFILLCISLKVYTFLQSWLVFSAEWFSCGSECFEVDGRFVRINLNLEEFKN